MPVVVLIVSVLTVVAFWTVNLVCVWKGFDWRWCLVCRVTNWVDRPRRGPK
jgi:hypothetical protein